MESVAIRTALVAVAGLSVLAFAAAPASATITAGASGGAVTGTSRNTALSRSGLGARCATSGFAGTVAADGLSASGELHFSNAAGARTCLGTFGVSCDVFTSGGRPTTVTLRSTGSTAGTSATFTIVLDAGFTYEVNCLGGALICTVSGPQTIRSAGTLRQGTPSTFVANARGIICAEGGLVDFTGTYTINERITIS